LQTKSYARKTAARVFKNSKAATHNLHLLLQPTACYKECHAHDSDKGIAKTGQKKSIAEAFFIRATRIF
jgi:hypothetical protein